MARPTLSAPEPKIRFYLHSVAAASGYRVIHFSVGMGERRPVRQATGYAAHPAAHAGPAGALRPWRAVL